MLNFFKTTIHVNVLLEDGNMVIESDGQPLCKGSIDSCITKLRQEIYNLSESKTVVIYLTNRSRLSSGKIEDNNTVTNKLYLMASSARCNVQIKRGLNYNA